MAAENSEFEFCGVNHLALVCKDMARTVEFYRDVLGMPLTKTIDLPGGRGHMLRVLSGIQHGFLGTLAPKPDFMRALDGLRAPALGKM